jgi:hypothetical protein
MHLARARPAPPSRLRLPWRTARLRLTALYGGLFLVSGVALLAGTYVLFERATEYRKPHLPNIPQTPAIHPLQLPRLPQALLTLAQDQKQLALALPHLTQAHDQLAHKPHLALPGGQLARDETQLTQAQHQLAQAVHQLSQAVHQVAQAGSVQAAQRAADSHQLLVDSGIALAIVGVLALLAGWFVAGRMLRPIRTITRTARRISSTSLHERLAFAGPEDELKELADTLDDLFGRRGIRGATSLRRQRLPRAPNAAHPRTRPRAGRPRRPLHPGGVAIDRPGAPQLKPGARTPDRGPPHPRQ